MLRQGLLELPPEEQEAPTHPLFSHESQRLLDSIQGSDLWKHLRAGIEASREALFASKPISTEDLWRTWGAIEALTTLLHGGPATVLQYSLLAAQANDTPQDIEREYNPKPHTFEG